jgi:Cu(I)/Ag(I) efflux system membrane fusion protein
MSSKRIALIAVLLAALGAAACKESGTDQPQGTSGSSSLSPEAQGAADEALKAYEALRAQLAADKIEEVSALAERLERAATEMARSVPASLQPRAVALGASARLMRETKEINKLREAFGEVSRQLVSILAIEPSLRKGRYVFECPMAQGYKKWIQNETKLSNPYMGKAMLECGSESSWTS